MKLQRTASGLHVPHEPPKQKTQSELYSEYASKHMYCPECGECDFSTTCSGSFIHDIESFKDGNRVSCACGWDGIRHDMVAKEGK